MEIAIAINLLNYPYSLADFEKALLAVDEEQVQAHKRRLDSQILIVNIVLKQKAILRRERKGVERRYEKERMRSLFSTLTTKELYQFTLQINHYQKIAKRIFDQRPELERLEAKSSNGSHSIPCNSDPDSDHWRLHGA